jgi:hypothetical protein
MVRVEFIPLPEFPQGFLMENYDHYRLEDDGRFYLERDLVLNHDIVERIPDVDSSVAHDGSIYTRLSPHYIVRRQDVRQDIREIYQKAVDRIQSIEFDTQPVRFMNQLHQLSKQPIELDGFTFVIKFYLSDEGDYVELRIANQISDTCVVGFITVAKVYDQRG